MAALLGGCALSEEDKAFYYTGWLNPNKKRNYDEHGDAPKHPAGFLKVDPMDR